MSDQTDNRFYREKTMTDTREALIKAEYLITLEVAAQQVSEVSEETAVALRTLKNKLHGIALSAPGDAEPEELAKWCDKTAAESWSDDEGPENLTRIAQLLRRPAPVAVDDAMQWFDWPAGEVQHGRLYLAELVRGGKPILVAVEASGEEVSFYHHEKDQYLTVDPLRLKWTGETF